jgi:hypothetical protein
VKEKYDLPHAQKQKAPDKPALSQSDMRLPEGRRKIDYLPEAIWPARLVNCVVIAVTMKGMMVTKQSDQTVFDSGCARFVFQKLLHMKLSNLFAAHSPTSCR